MELPTNIDQIAEKFRQQVEEKVVGGIDNILLRTEEYINEFYECSNSLGIKSVKMHRNYRERADKELKPMLYVIRRIGSERDCFRDELVKLRHAFRLVSVARSTGKTAEQESRIQELQTVAEYSAFLVFVPYYFGNAVSETYNVLWRVGRDEVDFTKQVIWGLAWLVGLSLLGWRSGFGKVVLGWFGDRQGILRLRGLRWL